MLWGAGPSLGAHGEVCSLARWNLWICCGYEGQWLVETGHAQRASSALPQERVPQDPDALAWAHTVVWKSLISIS